MGNFNVGAYGIVLRILNGYVVATSPEFGITITKRFDEVRKSEDIGGLYFDLFKKIGDEIENRKRKKRLIPTPKAPLSLVPKGEAPTLSISDVARILQTSADTVRRLVADQKLKCTLTRGGHRRFKSSDVSLFLNEAPALGLQTQPHLHSDIDQ